MKNAVVMIGLMLVLTLATRVGAQPVTTPTIRQAESALDAALSTKQFKKYAKNNKAMVDAVVSIYLKYADEQEQWDSEAQWRVVAAMQLAIQSAFQTSIKNPAQMNTLTDERIEKLNDYQKSLMYRLRAFCHRRLGDDDKAIEDIERALKLNPIATGHACRIYSAIGRAAEAAEHGVKYVEEIWDGKNQLSPWVLKAVLPSYLSARQKTRMAKRLNDLAITADPYRAAELRSMLESYR